MQTLFIDRKNAVMDVDSGRLILRVADERPTNLPLRLLEHVIVSARVELSTTVLLAFAKHGITLTITNPRDADNQLVCGGATHGNIDRKLSQYRTHLTAAERLECARYIVELKLRRHYQALARHRNRRADLRLPLSRALEQLRERLAAVKDATTVEALRGQEGAGAAAYFSAFRTLVPEALGFTARRRRPPPDPVNSLLSLGYTLVHSEARRALMAAGLDPMIGALHDNQYGRESLSCDLTELMRAAVDTWVVQLLCEQQLREHHFHTERGACLLSKEGRAIFYPLFHQQCTSWRHYLREEARRWAHYIDARPVGVGAFG